MQPGRNFTQSSVITIAYQGMGEGAFDLMIVPGFISHLEQA
jgi:hypothetical protein